MEETFNLQRLYSTTPYLRVLDKPFKIALNSLLPELKAYVLQRQKAWGDPLPFDLADYSIEFRLYDQNNNLLLQNAATISDATIGEIKYSWKPFDLLAKGACQGEFLFTKNNSSFTLPIVRNELQITVY